MSGVSGQGGCVRRIEVIVKIQKKLGEGGGQVRSGQVRSGSVRSGQVRVDVFEELKVL